MGAWVLAAVLGASPILVAPPAETAPSSPGQAQIVRPPGAVALARAFLRKYPVVVNNPDSVSSLAELFRRLHGKDPLKRSAAAAELRTIRQLAGRPDVVRIYLPPSRAGNRTPDGVFEVRRPRGGTRFERYEVKTVTGRKRGSPSRANGGNRLPAKANDVHAFKRAVKSGIRSKGGHASQLRVPLAVAGRTIPPTGTLVVHLPRSGASNTAIAERGMRELAPELARAGFLESVEVLSYDGSILGRWVRAPDGSYALDPRLREQHECPTKPGGGSASTGQTSPSRATGGLSSSDTRYVSAPTIERVAMAPCGEEETNQQPTSQPAPTLDGLAAPDLRGTLTEAQKLGGIDFSSLELRYLSVGSSDDPSTDYAFRARPTGGGANSGTVVDGIRNAMQASDSFFVWLSLPQSAFWVNLNPDEPDRIIDSVFGQTEAGQVLLESDLLLKKTDARLMDPNTALGDAYWSQLRPAPDGSYCVTYRVWIVPGTAKVRETGDSLYIVDAPLDVKVRPNEVRSSDCANLPEATQRHNAGVYRRLLLPKVKQQVNSAPEFEALRRVYLSRVAAEWYRQQSAAQSTAFGSLVDSGEIGRWRLQGSWKPRQTFRAFVKSFNQGEFTYTKRIVKGNVVEVHTYRTGGVDFTNIFKQNLSEAAFQSLSPGLTETVAKGLQQVAVDPRTKARWLGGESPVDPPSEETGSADPDAESTAYDGAPDDPWARDVAPYAVPLMVLLGAGLIAWAVLRERRRPSGPWGYR